MKKTLPGSLITALLVLLLGGALYGGEVYFLNSVNGKSRDFENKVSTMKTEADKLLTLQNASSALEENEQKVLSRQIKKSEIVAYLSSVEAIGRGLGTKVSIVSVAESQDARRPRATVSLLITGSFDAVLRTAGTLENSEYDTILTSMTLNSGVGEGKGKIVWNAATVLSVALVPPATTTPK